MEVRADYKQTEVGLIPSDWHVKSLVDVCSMRSGETITAESIDQFSQYPCYGGNGLRGFTSRATHKGTFALIGRQGALCGNVVGVQGEFFASEHAVVVTPSPNTSIRWLTFVLDAMQLNQYSESSAQPGLSVSKILRLPISLPPTIAEQEAIATALRDVDALIESLEQLIEKKRQIKQGAMQELLTGRRRLPGFEVTPGYKQTDVGVIPKDWDVKPVGEIGEALIGLTYKPSDVRSDGILVLRSSNVQEGTLRFDDNVFVDMQVPERIMVRDGDILICVRNGSRELIGKCALLDKRTAGMTFGAFMAVFRTHASGFVHQMMQSGLMKRQIHEHLGATINQITNKSLNSFLIPVPPSKEETDGISALLSDMDTEVEMLKAKLSKIRLLKQGMMQELLTGRIRLV